MKTKTRRIVVAFRLAGEPGRRKLNGFFRYLGEHRLDWQIEFVRIREDFSAEFVRSFAERGIDGVIYSMPAAKDGASELAKLTIPTVAVDIFDERILCGRTANLAYVSGSQDEIGRAAAQHLLAQGVSRSYAFVPDLYANPWSKQRELAFRGELKARGFPVQIYHTRRHGYDLPMLANWLRQLPRPVGIFVAFDDRAVQVLEACRVAGLSVPTDVAVLGVDNDEFLCAHTTPTLSSIQPDHELIGATAAAALERLMNGTPLRKPTHDFTPIKNVIARESTVVLSAAGLLVQRALAFIQINIDRPIRARDVVAHLKVSRRLADLRFQELLHESIGTAILNAKLDAARHLLSETRTSVSKVAESCGFPRLSRFSAAFEKRFGITPLAWHNNFF